MRVARNVDAAAESAPRTATAVQVQAVGLALVVARHQVRIPIAVQVVEDHGPGALCVGGDVRARDAGEGSAVPLLRYRRLTSL